MGQAALAIWALLPMSLTPVKPKHDVRAYSPSVARSLVHAFLREGGVLSANTELTAVSASRVRMTLGARFTMKLLLIEFQRRSGRPTWGRVGGPARGLVPRAATVLEATWSLWDSARDGNLADRLQIRHPHVRAGA